MKRYRVCIFLIFSAFTFAQCSFLEKPAESVDENIKLDPMVIKKLEFPGDTTEGMWDETYNTHLILKIHRLVRYEGSDQKSEFELAAEIPLFAQKGDNDVSVYGKMESEARARGEIAGGQAFSEATWKLHHTISGLLQPRPNCGMVLIVDEEWLEGEWCTTALGLTNCEPDEGGDYKMAYGILDFPLVVGVAENLESMNFESGNTTFETSIEVIPTGIQAVNLPDVSGCISEDITD